MPASIDEAMTHDPRTVVVRALTDVGAVSPSR
jgi:hypothetical protein